MSKYNLIVILLCMLVFAIAFLNASNIFYIVIGIGSLLFMLNKLKV